METPQYTSTTEPSAETPETTVPAPDTRPPEERENDNPPVDGDADEA